MIRIVVHAGFHKTGTTTVQRTLAINADRLSPHVRVLGKKALDPLGKACRAWSRRAEGVPDLSPALCVLDDLDPRDGRPVLLCSEDLAGLMPGRRGRIAYDATPALMTALCTHLTARFDHPAIRLHFSTRAADPWLRSVWWQAVRTQRFRESFDGFAARLAAAADLDRAVAAVEKAVAPLSVAVGSARLEAHAENPALPVLCAADIPPEVIAALEVPPPANRQDDPGLAEVFLALNRSGLSDEALHKAKVGLRRIAHNDCGLA